MENLTIGKILIIVLAFCVLLAGTIVGSMFLGQHLTHNQMRTEIEWAETWRAVALTLPPGTDLNEYILMRKIENTDIEHLETK